LISLEAGRPVKIEGNPAHPITQGFACAKTARYPERFAHPQRPLFPLHRSGAKGSGKWLRATWEEALSEISGALAEILDRAGGQAVLPYYYAGTMGLFE
jgi:anaerobic selenocysteine-containing dehydrogenase